MQTNSHVSESTVYRLLKAQDLIASPAFIVMQTSEKFSHPTTRVNQLWQTDFTYLKVIGCGWFYLSTVLDELRSLLQPRALSREPQESDAGRCVTMNRGEKILDLRQKTRNERSMSDVGYTINRRLLKFYPDEPETLLNPNALCPKCRTALTPNNRERKATRRFHAATRELSTIQRHVVKF